MPPTGHHAFDDAHSGFESVDESAPVHRVDSPHSTAAQTPASPVTSSNAPSPAARAEAALHAATAALQQAFASPPFAEPPGSRTGAASTHDSSSSDQPYPATDHDPDASEFDSLDSAAIRAAHEDDLIAFLQSWAEDLDSREARLNAEIAAQERRERAFRLWMMNRRAEIEDTLTGVREMQMRAETAARRLAIQTTHGR